MNSSKSTKRKHKLRTIRSRYARQFRGGAAATTDFISFITGSAHDNTIITTIIIAALFSGIYKQDETIMFNIAIKHILKGLTQANLEYVRRLMNAPHDVVDKALVYADKKTGREYDSALEIINGGSRRRTKNRLHLRRKSHKYKLQSGGDRITVVVMLFLFIMSCWFLFSELTALTAPQVSATLKDIPDALGIPNIIYSDKFVHNVSINNINKIHTELKKIIVELNIGFPSPLPSIMHSFTSATMWSPHNLTLPAPADIQKYLFDTFVDTVNKSLTTPTCTAAMKAIVMSLYNLANIANKHHYTPSTPTAFFQFTGEYTSVIDGSSQTDRDGLTQGWSLKTLQNIFKKIIPEELTTQFTKQITDRAEHIILSACGALGSFAFMFVLLIRKMTRSMISDASPLSSPSISPSLSPLLTPAREIEKTSHLVATRFRPPTQLMSSNFFNLPLVPKRNNGSYALAQPAPRPAPRLGWTTSPPYPSPPPPTPPPPDPRQRLPAETDTAYNERMLDLDLDNALAAMESSMPTHHTSQLTPHTSRLTPKPNHAAS